MFAVVSAEIAEIADVLQPANNDDVGFIDLFVFLKSSFLDSFVIKMLKKKTQNKFPDVPFLTSSY